MLGIRLDEGADLKSVGRNCLVGSSPTPSAYVPVATSARRLLHCGIFGDSCVSKK